MYDSNEVGLVDRIGPAGLVAGALPYGYPYGYPYATVAVAEKKE